LKSRKREPDTRKGEGRKKVTRNVETWERKSPCKARFFFLRKELKGRNGCPQKMAEKGNGKTRWGSQRG